MQEPIQVNFNLVQEDFIQVEILEQLFNLQDNKKHYIKGFILQSLIMLKVAIIIFFVEGIDNSALIFPAIFEVCFILNFLYFHFIGHKNDATMAISHFIESDAKGNNFFEEESGLANFFDEKCEYLTNTQRRFFNYDQIEHIKITKRLIVFVMRPSKEKAMRGFMYMVLPVRDISQENYEKLIQIFENIIKKYNLKPWIENTPLD